MRATTATGRSDARVIRRRATFTCVAGLVLQETLGLCGTVLRNKINVAKTWRSEWNSLSKIFTRSLGVISENIAELSTTFSESRALWWTSGNLPSMSPLEGRKLYCLGRGGRLRGRFGRVRGSALRKIFRSLPWHGGDIKVCATTARGATGTKAAPSAVRGPALGSTTSFPTNGADMHTLVGSDMVISAAVAPGF